MDKPTTTHSGQMSAAVPGGSEEQARPVDATGTAHEDGQASATQVATVTGSVASALRPHATGTGKTAP